MVAIAKDLRARFGAIRDQGNRPTCIAFATSDAHAAMRQQPFAPLSVEYLYFHAVQRSHPASPHGGVSVNSIAESLKLDGQPLEPDWPYIPALFSDLSGWRPPLGVKVFRRTMSNSTSTVSLILNALDSDQVAILTMMVSEAFYTPSDLGIVAHVAKDPDTAVHAVVAVGYGVIGGVRSILVRNSWGPNWGLNGYGWLYEDYLSTRLYAVSLIT